MILVQSSGRERMAPGSMILDTVTVTEETLRSVFLARLLGLMKERGIETGEALARLVGVSKTTGYNWLEGKLPRLEQLHLIAVAFEVTPNYLMGWEEIQGEEVVAVPKSQQQATLGEAAAKLRGAQARRARREDQRAGGGRG